MSARRKAVLAAREQARTWYLSAMAELDPKLPESEAKAAQRSILLEFDKRSRAGVARAKKLHPAGERRTR
jgi:hypothetical protein